MLVTCDRCEKSYYMRPSHYARYKQHFCSTECYGLSERGENNPRWKNNHRRCNFCEKEYKPYYLKSLFCSKKCAQGYKSRKMSKEIECVICGKKKKIILARVFKENCCSLSCTHKLHSKRMTRDGNSNWRGGIGNLPWSYEFNKGLKKSIKERDNNVCKMCGLHNEVLKGKRGYGIQIHHIDYNKQNNKENNLISLCNYCHGKVNYTKEIWQPKLSKLLQK